MLIYQEFLIYNPYLPSNIKRYDPGQLSYIKQRLIVMEKRKKDRIIIICYIISIISAVCSITLIALLFLSSGYNRNLSDKYDFLLRFLACVFFLGIIIPPFITAYIKENKP